MNGLAEKITQRLVNHGAIDEKDLDVYIYGIELILSSLICTLMILTIGILLRKALETLIFLFIFILLRSFSGGYHARTYIKCTLVTLSLYCVVIILSQFQFLGYFSYGFLLIFGIVALLIMAPIENVNKEMSKQAKKKYKFISLTVFLGMCILGTILISIDKEIASVIWCTLFSVLALMFPPKLKERRKNTNESN